MNRFNANYHTKSSRQCHAKFKYGGQKIKVQGHNRPNIDLEAWRRHHSQNLEWSR